MLSQLDCHLKRFRQSADAHRAQADKGQAVKPCSDGPTTAATTGEQSLRTTLAMDFGTGKTCFWRVRQKLSPSPGSAGLDRPCRGIPQSCRLSGAPPTYQPLVHDPCVLEVSAYLP